MDARPPSCRIAWGVVTLAGAATIAVASSSPRMWGLLLNTALLTCGALVLAMPLGAVLGIVVGKIDLPGRRSIEWLLVGLLFVPLYVYAGAWHSVLGPGGWTHRPGAAAYADPWLAGWRGAVWVHGMAAVPWVALAVAMALRAVERRLEEESLLDAPAWRVLLGVSLPRALGGMLAGAAFVAVVCATEIVVTDIYQIRTFAEEVYAEASLGSLVGPGAAAAPTSAGMSAPLDPLSAEPFRRSDLALGVAALVLLTMAAFRHFGSRLPPAEAIGADAGWRWRPVRERVLLAAIAWVLVAAVVLVPLAGLAWKAGIEVNQVAGEYHRSWSCQKLLTMTAASPWEHRREWGWSLAIGSMAAVAAAGAGLIVGWLARRHRRVRSAAATAAALAIALPAPLLAVWVIAVLNRPPDSHWAWLSQVYDRTLAAPVLVQSVRALPLVGWWLWSQLASVPPDLLDAARSEGAGPWRQLLRVAIPLRWSAVGAALAAGLAICFGELSATMLAAPPGVTTVSIRVFQMLHYGVDDRVAALCLSIFGVVGAGVAAAAVLARASAHRVRRPPPR